MRAYLPHQLSKWGRRIDGQIATESPGGLKRNAWANKNGINGRIRTDYAPIKDDRYMTRMSAPLFTVCHDLHGSSSLVSNIDRYLIER